MLNNLSPFQTEIVQHYMAERKKRAKAIAEAFATQQHGPAPQKQNAQGGAQNGPRSTNVASTLTQSNSQAGYGPSQSSNQFSQ